MRRCLLFRVASEIDLAHHEVLHAASMICSMFDKHVLTTAYVESHPKLKASALAISGMLGAFYQAVGVQLPSLLPSSVQTNPRSLLSN